MKKRYAIILTAAMITGVTAATAFAEEPAMDGAPQMSGPQVPGGNENSQPPQMESQQAPQMENQQAPGMNTNQAPQGEAPSDNGQQAPQGEAPASNNQQAPQGEAPTGSNQQAPQMNNNQAPQGEAPIGNDLQNSQNRVPSGKRSRKDSRMNSRMDGRDPKDGFGFVSFEDYVKDGTISQETYDAITKYMEENKPELPEGTKEGEQPEKSEGTTEGERPELPADAKDGEKPELKEGDGPDLLKDLLSASVITQEQYDTLVAKREASKPSAPVNTQESTSDQKTDNNGDT